MKIFAAFSTSSSYTSVALLDEAGNLLFCLQSHAPFSASNACLETLEQGLKYLGRSKKNLVGFLSDIGPGSFTGVKVGVTLAKTLAFSLDCQIAGASSFDLISPDQACAVPIRKGLYLVRHKDGVVENLAEITDEDMVGYGPDFNKSDYPNAKNFSKIFKRLSWFKPEEFVPNYIAEPNISQPKKKYF